MTPILIGGVSRGGILSTAYAGQHLQQVAGVVNFVGGWIGEGCSTASEVNGALFRRGAPFQRPALRLYGDNDSFYSLGHSRSNFAAFQNAGGKGTFSEFEVPNKSNGHFLSSYPQLWLDAFAGYLMTLKAYQ
jgi:pimeloyl-ACP methyl ester carboxylesterase